jgi:hypothetical protein
VLKLMKYLVGIVVFLWLLCGLIGAFMEDELSPRHWDTIAKGPITLIHAINDNPLSVPSLG